MEENKQKNLSNATCVGARAEAESEKVLCLGFQETESEQNVAEVLQLQNDMMKARFQ